MITKFQIFEKTYVTHGNGGRPFAVDYDEKHGFVDILKNKYNRYPNVKKIWNGDKKDDDSSVLIEFPHKKYMFVGTEVYEFETDEFITDYYSKIGNSDVPYPVALSKNYVYIMLDKVYIDRKVFPDDTDWKDCYRFYYDHQSSLPLKKFKNLKLVEETNERINWKFWKKNNPHKEVDPYGEEEWDNPTDIHCEECGKIIPNKPDTRLFVINGKPLCADAGCVWRWTQRNNVVLKNVSSLRYKQAKKLLKKGGPAPGYHEILDF